MTDIPTEVKTPQPAFSRPTTQRTMGSQCTRCKGTGFLPLPSTVTNLKASDLARTPCDNPACTVNRVKEKLGRNELNILMRKTITLASVAAVVSVMPAGRDAFEYNESVSLTSIKATALLDEVWEAAHQRIDDYRKMALVSLDIDGHHYTFTSKDTPECGRLTTEHKPKGQPAMSPEEKQALLNVPFDDEQKPADAPAPLSETIKPLTEAQINDLKERLLKRVETTFPGETERQHKDRLRKALEAETFADFLHNHRDAKNVAEVGDQMVDAYIMANGIKKGIQPTASPAEPPSPEPTIAVETAAESSADAKTEISQLSIVRNDDHEDLPDDLPYDSGKRITVVRNNHDLIRMMLQIKTLVKDIDYGDVAGVKKPTLLKPGAEKLVTAFNLRAVPTLLPDTVVDWKNEFFYFHYQYQIFHRESGLMIASANGSCNSMESKYRWRWIEQTELAENGIKPDGLKFKATVASEFQWAVDKAETTGKYGKAAEYWQMFKDAIASGKAVKGEREIKSGEKRPTWEITTKLYRVQNDDIPSIVNTIDKMAQKRALVAAVLISTAASAYFTQDIEDMPNFGSIETVA